MSFNRNLWIQQLNNLAVGQRHQIPFTSIPGITNENGELSRAYLGKKQAFVHKTIKSCYNSCGFEFVDVDFQNNVLVLERVSEGEIQDEVHNNVRERRANRRSTVRNDANLINYNEDLNLDLLEMNEERTLVLINKTNAEIIADQINSSPRYSYVRAVPELFAVTNPGEEELTIEKVIQRLIIIDQIDSVNIGMQTKAYEYIAESIINNNLERYIREGEPIPNAIFRNIAVREKIVDGNPWNYFSAISKYIARTAHYIYQKDSGYPIYDSVLCDNLHLYICGISNNTINNIAKNCNYEQYCSIVNNYLEEVNQNKVDNEKVTNLMFDQIVWYTHKNKSATQKYR